MDCKGAKMIMKDAKGAKWMMTDEGAKMMMKDVKGAKWMMRGRK